MKKNIQNQPENNISDTNSRRGFIKAASLLGLGSMAAGPTIPMEINTFKCY
jgi:hypothetical protein